MKECLVILNTVEWMDDQARSPRTVGTCFGESDVEGEKVFETDVLDGLLALRVKDAWPEFSHPSRM